MTSASWPLVRNRPAIRLSLIEPDGDRAETRLLLADTGAGPNDAVFDLLLDEEDCLLFCTDVGHYVRLSGAYTGSYRIYYLGIEIPELNLAMALNAVGIPSTPRGFNGIAAFRFLNRFSYGNFGDPLRFGLRLK